MKKLIASGAGVLAICASAAMFGAGAASADDLAGQTYADASKLIAQRSGTPVVSAKTGDQLPLDECIVTSSYRSPTIDALTGSKSNKYLLSLSCNAAVAEAGKPGNSVQSPAGRAAQNDIDTAARIEKNPEWCHEADDNMEYCQKICDKTGRCEVK